ncbi:MAG: hypothetical protein ACRDGM_02550 [bacterium]
MRYAVVAAVILVLVWTAGGFARTDEETMKELDRETLRGLQGVYVLVEHLEPTIERDGLRRDQIRTDVELRLRQAGIPVPTEEERLRTPGTPYLYIRVASHSDSGLHAFHIAVELRQAVLLERNPAKFVGARTTWEFIGAVGTVGSSKVRKLREVIADAVDEFINAYLTVNPRGKR